MPQINNALITGACVAEQQFLVNIFGKNVPVGRDTGDFGVFQALLDSQNVNGVTINELLTGINAKRRTVVLYYDNAQCYEVCAKVGTCTTIPAVTKPTMGEIQITIANEFTVCEAGANVALTMDAADWEKYCVVNDGEKWQTDIATFDYRFFQGLNKLLAAEINSLIPVAQTETIKMTLPTATGGMVIHSQLQFHIEQKLRDAGMDDKAYFILGGSKLKQLMGLAQIQSASTEGFDMTKQGDLGQMFYSKAFDAIAPGAIIVVPWMTLQLITYAENRGSFQAMTELVTKETKLFPIGNGKAVEFDYLTKYDPSCSIRSYQPSVLMELVKTVPGGCSIVPSAGLPIWKFIDCTVAADLTC